jgi:hypothetical protein
MYWSLVQYAFFARSPTRLLRNTFPLSVAAGADAANAGTLKHSESNCGSLPVSARALPDAQSVPTARTIEPATVMQIFLGTDSLILVVISRLLCVSCVGLVEYASTEATKSVGAAHIS